ncbi:MAG TPA: nitrate/sulfonate/bicarbonate ABC transporter ATP-binding protein [Stellaceae bacterium]|jgi:NitT/TauT family transport system ATP-binding protein|nr:nitrate/sulfonate/bicarbonate ABC transporter ATP-binding protein [Stellaceae bacterium]
MDTLATTVDTNLISASGICKTYQQPDHAGRLVLDHIDFTLKEGEIVAILGKSGSGKSTFLRVIAGLTQPSAGAVSYRGQQVYAPAQGIAMVFQSFALFPWLTVLGNVELGLEAQGVPRDERRQRAIAAIDLIGLDGFESAYPKELSGGMRQRVGFARALVVNPDVLLLDEPFSALDVLTAETLRSDIMDLWLERRVPTKGILFVSHNIEEAVDIADRIIIFGSDPGCIRAEIPVPLNRPRDWAAPAFRRIVDEVYTLLTTVPGREGGRRGGRADMLSMQYRLPDASIQQLVGLLDLLVAEPFNGRADLPHLAESEHITTDDLVVMLEALQLMGFAQVGGGDIDVTPVGRAFAEADLQGRKQLFAESLMRNIGFIAHIRRVLDERPGHAAPEARFLGELEDHLSEEEAQRVLETVINWGRYAELFAYDYDRGVLSLENPQ